VTVLGANDVRLFPVPSACSPNPADVILTDPRAPCPVPTPTVRPRQRGGGGGGWLLPAELVYRIDQRDEKQVARQKKRRVVAQLDAKKIVAEAKRVVAPAEAKRTTLVARPPMTPGPPSRRIRGRK
jgi:hypothetical protein